MKFGTPVSHVPGYKYLASFFLIFAQELSYDFSKLKKLGKIITKSLKDHNLVLGQKLKLLRQCFVDLAFLIYSAKIIFVFCYS